MSYLPKASIVKQLNIKCDTKRSAERQELLTQEDQKVLHELQAFIAYIEGASLPAISEEFDIKYEILKYKIKKLKSCGIKGLLDQRESNGSYQEKKITPDIGQRILEIKIQKPSLSSREIAEASSKQDKTQVSHVIVNEYINQLGLQDYSGSPFRDSLFPPWRKELLRQSIVVMPDI